MPTRTRIIFTMQNPQTPFVDWFVTTSPREALKVIFAGPNGRFLRDRTSGGYLSRLKAALALAHNETYRLRVFRQPRKFRGGTPFKVALEELRVAKKNSRRLQFQEGTVFTAAEPLRLRSDNLRWLRPVRLSTTT